MSHTVQRHRYWLIPVCIVLAGIVCLFGWQGLSAQTPPAAAPAIDPMTGQPVAAAPAAAAPAAEPTVAFRAAMPMNVKSANIKNWDGRITGFLSFKYKTMDKRVIKVYLPATYKTQSMTRAAWDTLFQCYGMDREAVIAQTENDMPNLSLTSEEMGKAITQISMLPDDRMDGGAPSPASGAMDKARGSMGSIWASGQIPAPIF